MRTMIAAMLLISGQAPVVAQDRRVIMSAESCPTCKVTIERVVRLGQYDTVSVAQFSTVSRDENGNYYVGSTYATGTILVFSPTGKLIRTFGKRGSGPGEISSAWWMPVLPRNDSVLVFDSGNQRLSVFTIEGVFARSEFLPAALSYLLLPTNKVVFTGIYGSRDNFGYPIHVAGSDRRSVHSFGLASGEEILSPDDPDLIRRLAPSPESGTFWAHYVSSYAFDLWRADGALIGSYERRTNIFPPSQRYDRWNPRPTDIFIGMRETPLGVLTLSADEQDGWESAFPRAARAGGEARYPNMSEMHRVYDTVFEFLDVDEGVVVKRGRHDQHFSGFVNDTLIYSVDIDAAGRSYVDIWQVRLRGAP